VSSDDSISHMRNPEGGPMNGLVLFVGLLALLISAGCGGGSAGANGGGGGGPVAASIRHTVTVGTAPSGIAVDSTNNKIYVADFGAPPPQTQFVNCPLAGGDITVIDGASDSPSAVPIQPGSGVDIDPVAIALSETSHTAYVLAEGWSWLPSNGEGCFQNLSVILAIDTSTLKPVGFVFGLPPSEGFFLSGMAVDQSTGSIYAGYGAAGDNIVIVITASGYSEIPVSAPPGPITVNETTKKIYAAFSNGIMVIDGATNSVASTITDPSPATPTAIAIDPTTNTIYVANALNNSLTVIDGATNTVTATIPVGTSPSGVAVDSQTNFIYVANAGNSETGDPGNITVIDGATNATTTLRDSEGLGPSAVAVNSVTNKIYVANSLSNNVTVIDGAHD
jgi:YVTN family beta-propeller protein